MSKPLVARLTAAATAAVGAQDAVDAVAAVEVVVTALVKYAGTDTPLEVPLGPPDAMATAFAAQHRARFGFAADTPLLLDAVRVEAIGRAPQRAVPGLGVRHRVVPATAPQPERVTMAGETVPLFDRSDPSSRLCRRRTRRSSIDAGATAIVERGWMATIGSQPAMRC